MPSLIDYTGMEIGRLKVLSLVPASEHKYKSNAREWYCQCSCGKIIQVQTRMISGNGKYTQQSCGCIRVKTHLTITSKIEGLDLDYIEQYKDFEKYQFLHKTYVKHCGAKHTLKEYNEFISYFYVDSQFNSIYKSWKENEVSDNTYYNWYKPSLDHIIPKSRGGTNEIKNLQFLTVFENLSKRDMTMNEWENFKKLTNTKSNLFIR